MTRMGPGGRVNNYDVEAIRRGVKGMHRKVQGIPKKTPSFGHFWRKFSQNYSRGNFM